MARPVTLITGASAGLGVEFARQCAARGETVALAARRRDRLEALAAELPDAKVFAIDLAAPDAAASLVSEIEAEGLHVRTLINNAGIGLAGRFAELPIADQQRLLLVNMIAPTGLCRLLLPGMIARGEGGILNVASTAAFQAGPNMAVYYASKAYLLSLSEALHQEAKGTGVKVSCLCPGPVATEFFEAAGMGRSAYARMAGDAGSVVRAGLRGLDRNKAVVVPGIRNRIGAQATRFLPRAALRRIVAAIKV